MLRISRASEAAQLAAEALPVAPPPQSLMPVTVDGRRASRSLSKRVSTEGGELMGQSGKKARKSGPGAKEAALAGAGSYPEAAVAAAPASAKQKSRSLKSRVGSSLELQTY